MEFKCECGHVETMALTSTERLALNGGRAVFVCPECGKGHDKDLTKFPPQFLNGRFDEGGESE